MTPLLGGAVPPAAHAPCLVFEAWDSGDTISLVPHGNGRTVSVPMCPFSIAETVFG